VIVVSSPGRRAGLEFVEKLLTSAMVALLDGRDAGIQFTGVTHTMVR
jgi:hypothetical protein